MSSFLWYKAHRIIIVLCNFAHMEDLRIICTGDLHGAFMPYDLINHRPMPGTMARIAHYVDRLRQDLGHRVVLLDNGDILQGQPSCYYCNFIHPELPNVAAEITNYLHYDAQTIGNHDIETGHAVFDKWKAETQCPILGANVITSATGQPYFKPYTILIKAGLRVAVVGMLTPTIAHWLHPSIFSGLHFESMVDTAKFWIEYIRQNERPDLIIGLFHSGLQGGITTTNYAENETLQVAQEVAGFDVIFYGHDHQLFRQTITNAEGNQVLLLNPSSNGRFIAEVTVRSGHIKGRLINIEHESVSQSFINRFTPEFEEVRNFVNRKIATFHTPIRTRDCYFGNSAFCDLIHDLQLRITKADISFNAPLSYDTSIEVGDVHVSDMFNLYAYENQIYVLQLTGYEIHRYLEMSYDLWVHTMQKPEDPLMRIIPSESHIQPQQWRFANLAFNFDSACGIDYEVDVRQPYGHKVHILGMTDGHPFHEDRIYKVAMNSYRGNGGGELLTLGAGIAQHKLKDRIVYMSSHDQRYLFTTELEHLNTLSPKAHHNWRFVPEAWTRPAIERERKLIFPHTK